MKIELFGGGFANKGGELMLRTAVARLRQRRPDIRLGIEPDLNSTYESHASLGLAHIFPTASIYPARRRWLMTRSQLLTKLLTAPLRWSMPSAVDPVLGLLDRRGMDGFVDISGYAFGDGFSWRKTQRIAQRTKEYVRRGKPVVFLPQMFGPFTNPKIKKYFQQAVDNATRIYAREQVSYDAVRAVIGDDPRLKIAPDITITSTAPSDWSDAPARPESDYAIIVPNERLLDQGKEEWGDTYRDRLLAIGERIHHHGLIPAVVVHSTDRGDLLLAEQLVASLNKEFGGAEAVLFTHPHPLALKKYIAGARFVVGSRFHSLVAALSSGVPAVALGWAHKYEMLATDFGVPQLVHRGADSQEHILNLIDELIDSNQNASLRKTIAEHHATLQEASEAMWEDVYGILGMAGPAQ